MEKIQEMLNSLSELTDEQLAELKTAIVSEFETVSGAPTSAETVKQMTALADALDTVRGTESERAAAAEALAAQAAEATARVQGDGTDSVDPEQAPVDEVVPVEDPAVAGDAPVVVTETPVEGTPPADDPTDADAPGSAPDDEDKNEDDKKFSTEGAPAAELATEEATIETSPVTEASAEVTETATEASAEATPATEASAEVAPETEASTETETPESAEAPAAELSTENEASAELSTVIEPNTEAQNAQEEQEAPVTAAATDPQDLDIQAPADRQPIVESAGATVAITAGADVPRMAPGQEIPGMDGVAEAFTAKLHALRRVSGGVGEQHIVASISTNYPESRQLGLDVESNITKIKDVAGPEALVASGGHAAPFEVKYDIFGLGTTARPVRDALPRFQADRGGVRYVTPPVLTSYGAAVGVWTNVLDITPGTAVKDSLTVTAAAEVTVATDAVTLQLQFGNLMSRAFPELIARHNELALIMHAREAEQYLLSKIDAASTAVTSTNLIGVARDFLIQVGRAAAAYRSRHRMDPDAPLRVIIPAWVLNAMQADLALQMPGDATLAVATAEIEGYIKARHINLSVTLDQNIFGAQSTGAMNEFPDTFVWRIFAEGTFLFLDGGTLDLGIIRDSTLVSTNDYKMFIETFEGIAYVGVESLAVTSTIQVNGAAAALRDVLGGVTAAVIEL